MKNPQDEPITWHSTLPDNGDNRGTLTDYQKDKHIELKEFKDYNELQKYLANMPYKNRLNYLTTQVEQCF